MIHTHIEQKIDLSCRTSLNNTSGSSNDVPPFMLSHEMEVELSEAALGQSEEEHLSKKSRIMEVMKLQESALSFHVASLDLNLLL